MHVRTGAIRRPRIKHSSPHFLHLRWLHFDNQFESRRIDLQNTFRWFRHSMTDPEGTFLCTTVSSIGSCLINSQTLYPTQDPTILLLPGSGWHISIQNTLGKCYFERTNINSNSYEINRTASDGGNERPFQGNKLN